MTSTGPDENGWFTTSHIAVGTQTEIFCSSVCKHEFLNQGPEENEEECVIQYQKCKHCCSFRARYKPK